MNIYWYKFNDADNKPVATAVCDECPDGFVGFNGGENIDWTTNNYSNGKIVPIIIEEPVAPIPYVRTLEEAKADKKAYFKTVRDDKEANDGFVYLEKTFDSDDKSITRLNVAVGAAQSAIINNEEFTPITWTLKDNSSIELTASQLVGIPMAIAISKGALHVTYRTLCDVTIEAATTVEEVDDITWVE